MTCQGQALRLIGSIRKLRRKLSVANMTHGSVGKMDPLRQSVSILWDGEACQEKHLSLLGPLISYKENEVLRIWHM